MTVSKQTTYVNDIKSSIEDSSPAIGTIARTTDTNELGVYGASGWDFIRRNRTTGCTATLDGVDDMPVPYYNLDFLDNNSIVLNDSGSQAVDGDSVSRVTGDQCTGFQNNALNQPTYLASDTAVVGNKGTGGTASVNVSVNDKPGLYFDYPSGMEFGVPQTGTTEYTSFLVFSVPCVYNARRVGTDQYRQAHNASGANASVYRSVFYDKYNNYAYGAWFPSMEWYTDTTATYFYYQRSNCSYPCLNQRHDQNNTAMQYYEPLDYDQTFLNKTYILVTRARTQALDENTNPANPNPSILHDSNRVDMLNNLPSTMSLFIKPASVVRFNNQYFECEKTHVAVTSPSVNAPEWKAYTPDTGDNLVGSGQRVISDWANGRTYWGPADQRLADDVSTTFVKASFEPNGGSNAKFDNYRRYNQRAGGIVGRTGFDGWAEGNKSTTLPHTLHQRVEFTEYMTNEQIFSYTQALREKWDISNMSETTDLTKQYVELQF